MGRVESQEQLAASWRQLRAGTTVFNDPFAVELLDDRVDYGEQRFIILGMAESQVLLFVAYAERDERIRIISARRATQHEQDDYFRQNS